MASTYQKVKKLKDWNDRVEMLNVFFLGLQTQEDLTLPVLTPNYYAVPAVLSRVDFFRPLGL